MRKAAVSAVSIVMCIFMLTGCFFFGKTLEERMTPRQRQRIADEIKAQEGFDEYFKDVEENHIYIRYYFAIYMDDLQITAMKSYLLNAGYDQDIRELKDEVEKFYGIRPDIVTFEFYTTDDRQIGKIER